MKKIISFYILFYISIYSYSQVNMSDFSVIVNNIEISLGIQSNDILEKLGKKKYEIYDNSYITLRKYLYSWGSLYTANEDNGYIYGVIATSQAVKTKKNIYIGSSKEDVIATYGQPYSIRGNDYYFLNYDFDVLELKITFDDSEKVCFLSIFMGS